jgi:hypothetical protein
MQRATSVRGRFDAPFAPDVTDLIATGVKAREPRNEDLHDTDLQES